MATFHCDGSQTILIGGPAKVDLVADDAPVISTRPAPTITSLSPATAVHGDPDITLTVVGTNFSTFTKIQISGVDVPTTYVDPTHVSTPLQVSKVTAAGTIPVVVRNGSRASAATNFTFT